MGTNQSEQRWWQRLVTRLVSSRVGSWICSYTLHHIDNALLRLSDGRVSTPQLLAGLPVVRLTTTGARTGKERTVPVLGFRDGDEWFLIASNWGAEGHPAWYHNLKANPEVTLRHDDQTGRYVAEEVTGERRESYWRQANQLYPGYEAYRRRSGNRHIPVVVLRPIEE